jgi:hypothetical protein
MIFSCEGAREDHRLPRRAQPRADRPAGVISRPGRVALAHPGGSTAALFELFELFELLEAADYVLLTIDDETGEPIPLRSTNRPPSDNIVAVHVERDWGLLAR